jgi:Family of unknown function (DUF6496)
MLAGCNEPLRQALVPAERARLGRPEEIAMAQYGKKAQSKVKRAMHKRKEGTLKSGRSGRKVKSRKQAIAIGLSEARKAGGKVPSRKKSASRKKGGSKKGGAKKKRSSRKKS